MTVTISFCFALKTRKNHHSFSFLQMTPSLSPARIRASNLSVFFCIKLGYLINIVTLQQLGFSIHSHHSACMGLHHTLKNFLSKIARSLNKKQITPGHVTITETFFKIIK